MVRLSYSWSVSAASWGAMRKPCTRRALCGTVVHDKTGLRCVNALGDSVMHSIELIAGLLVRVQLGEPKTRGHRHSDAIFCEITHG